jgi:predicted lipoprotein with Yx(FWY)xxD motif
MRRLSVPQLPSPTRAALVCAAVVALLVPAMSNAAPAGRQVAKQAENATLGRTILTTTRGRTLYSLSVETHGRFVCTGACTSTWRPLLLPAGAKPVGPVRLGTVQRPDGRIQVTFKGRPLYSFYGDSKAGQVNGEGIKDVGTWHAAVIAKAAPQPEPQPETPYPY